MPHPPWEDLSEFFDLDEFAQNARIFRGEEDFGEVVGIFDNPTERQEIGDFTLDQVGPRFVCDERAGLIARRGDVLVIDGSKFDVVHKPKRDGTGLVVIELAAEAGSHAAI